MTRALVVAACLGATARAHAGGRTGKVTIETDPPGAKVYFGLKEDGEVCTTPCTIDAPVGETTIIVEAENRRSIYDSVVVPRKGARPLRLSYKLAPAIGTLVVEGARGATIKIDDEASGTAPARIDGVVAGAHHVVIEQNGAALYDQFLEIEAGQEAVVTPAPAAAAAPRAEPDPPVIATGSTAPPPPTTVTVTAALDVAFRQFSYSGNQTPATQRDDREAGQLLAGPIVEVWPAALLDMTMLHGLAVYARFEVGLNAQPVTTQDPTTHMTTSTSLSTAWRSLELSVHQRWGFASAGAIEVGAGYAQDSYQFKGDAAEVAVVPDASYSAVRIGARASLALGAFEPYVAAENRLVLSGGELGSRYKLGSSVNGVHGALGAAAHVGRIELRVEGALTLYSWTFRSDVSDSARASGGSDFIQTMTVAVGYHY